MGTLVSYGRGRGVVVSTGMHTQLGLIASMLQNVEVEETPLQRRLDQLGKTLSIGALILVAVVFILELIDATNISVFFLCSADLSSNIRQRNYKCLYHRGQPCDCGGAGGIACGGDDQPGAGNARDDSTPRADPAAGFR